MHESNRYKRERILIILMSFFVTTTILMAFMATIYAGRMDVAEAKLDNDNFDELIEILSTDDEIQGWDIEYFDWAGTQGKYSINVSLKNDVSLYINDRDSLKELTEEYKRLVGNINKD